MSVKFLNSSRSHPAGTKSVSESSFAWQHASAANEKGIVVFTFSQDSTDNVTAVTYGGQSLTPVTDGRATYSSSYPKDCKAWFLGSDLSQQFLPNDADGTWSSKKGPLEWAYSAAYHDNQWAIAGWQVVYTDDIEKNQWNAIPYLYGNKVKFLNNQWIILGYPNSIHYTHSDRIADFVDSSKYSSVTVPSTFSYDYSTTEIAYGNGTWVVVTISWDANNFQYNNQLFTATSLTSNWNTADISIFTNPYGNISISSITYGNGYFVAGGYGSMGYATDPAGTWTEVNISDPDFQYDTINHIKFLNGYFVAVTNFGYLYYTTDPSGTWTQVNIAYNNYNYQFDSFNRNLGGIDFGNGLWAISGGYGVMFYSSSLSGPWSQSINSISAYSDVPYLRDLIYGNNQFLTVGVNYGYFYTGGHTKEIVVARNNNNTSIFAMAVSVSAIEDTYISNVVLDEDNMILSEKNIDDNLPKTSSLRLAAVNSNLRSWNLEFPPFTESLTLGQNSSWLQNWILPYSSSLNDNDYYVLGLVRETGTGRGSRPVGFASITSDYTAAVYLAISDTTTATDAQFIGWGIPIF